jgi:hypothetical protein
MLYILEVQQFDELGHISHPEWNGTFNHIGYINALFKSKQSACDYYDQLNPNMRSLNAHNNWCSDWNPVTKFRYVVRTYNGEFLKIPPQ